MTEISKNAEQVYETFMSYFDTIDDNDKTLDVDNLKLTGTVKETEIEEDDSIVRIIDYKSNDGTLKIKSVYTYNKTYLITRENREIKEQIKLAVALDDFERAADLKKQLRKKS